MTIRRLHLKYVTLMALPLAAALATPLAAQAAEPANKPAAKPLSAAASAAQARKRSTERAKELAEDTVEQVNAAQLDVADRVLTGIADCEFNQKVTVEPMEGHAGHFHVRHNKVRYTMVPRETTTGAVRLEDKRAGVVWLQIPTKSMLMNTKIGQRMVDSCTQAEQRAAVQAVQGATGTGIGIVPERPAKPAAPAAASAPAAAQAPAAVPSQAAAQVVPLAAAAAPASAAR